MAILCVIIGLFEIIAGIIWLAYFHDNFAFIGIGIGEIISALIILYVAYLGGTHVSDSKYEKDIKRLTEELEYANSRIEVILRNTNNPNLEKEILREEMIRKSRISLEAMPTGFPVILKNEKKVTVKDKNICIPAGTKGTFKETKDNYYKIKFVLDDKGYFVFCRADEVVNFYANELQQEENSDKKIEQANQ